MNLGLLVRYALNKAELPFDSEHIEMAKVEANDIISNLWYSVKAKWRTARGTIETVGNSDEYVLPKDLDEFTKYTLQSDTIRFDYKEPEEFFRLVRINQDTSGEAYIYTFGDMSGVDNQLTTAARIRAVSSLASKTYDNVNVTAGSVKVTSDFDIFSLNDVGLRFKKDGDSVSYKIGNFVNSKEIHLTVQYRGATSSNSDYKIGDVGIHVNIQGYVGGQMTSEDVELDGANEIMTDMTFNTIVSVSKSDRTGGVVSVANQANTRTVATLAPGELEIERQTVLFWPVPDANGEELTFRYFMKHPYLWVDTDRPLIPQKYHPLIRYKLERKMLEAAGVDVPQSLMDDIAKLQNQLEEDSEDISLTDTHPRPDGSSRFGDAFLYDKDEDLYI